MDTAFLRAILEHDGVVPEGYSVQGLTPELLELLSSTDMGRREASRGRIPCSGVRFPP